MKDAALIILALSIILIATVGAFAAKMADYKETVAELTTKIRVLEKSLQEVQDIVGIDLDHPLDF